MALEAKIEKLTAKNYTTWKIIVESLLKSKGLFKYVATNIESEDEKLLMKNEEAKHIMYSLMDPQQIMASGVCDTAYDLWEKIKSNQEGAESDMRNNAYTEFLGFSYSKGESIVSYCGRYELALGRVEALGQEVEEQTKLWVLRRTLPSDLKQAVKFWMMANQSGKVGSLITQLKLDYHMDKLEKDFESVALIGKAQQPKRDINYEPKTRQIICNYCKKAGHKWRDCRKRKADNESSIKPSKEKNDVAFNAVEIGVMMPSIDHWIIDSGASSHMTPRREILIDYEELEEPRSITLGNGIKTEVIGKGKVSFMSGEFIGSLYDVLLVPGLRENLFSVGSALKRGCEVEFSESEVIFRKNGQICLKGFQSYANLFVTELKPRQIAPTEMAAVSIDEWHYRFGHASKAAIQKLIKNDAVKGLELAPERKICHPCAAAKITRASHGTRTQKMASETSAVLDVDTCGPFSTESLSGSKYFVLGVEEFSNYKLIKFARSKLEIPSIVKELIVKVELESRRPVKMLRSDNGSEYVNSELSSFMVKRGIIHEKSAPFTPEQNGMVERANRTVLEASRAMLEDSKLPDELWAEAAATAVIATNHLIPPGATKTRFEIYWGHKPDVTFMKKFGQPALVLKNPNERKSKWEPKGKLCYFVGYESRRNTYRMFDQDTGKIIISCNVNFLSPVEIRTGPRTESDSVGIVFPTDPRPNDNDPGPINKSDQGLGNETTEDASDDIRSISDISDIHLSETEIQQLERYNETGTINQEPTISEDDAEGNSGFITDSSSESIDNGPQTRSKAKEFPNDIIKTSGLPKHFWEAKFALFTLDDEPGTLKQAQASDEWPQWKEAMLSEMAALKKNLTWELVDKPKDRKLIDCKWVFKRKPEMNDHTKCIYKARLVARGFSQIPNVDFKETYAPVARMTTIRLIFALANQLDMDIMQFDIATAFLNGDLKETIYMSYPEGFPNPTKKVCLLKKGLYGLKQAPRNWNMKFDSMLKMFDLIQSRMDSCLYYNRSRSLILIIYVDDGLAISNDKVLLDKLIQHLKGNFELKVVPCVSYLGFQVKRNKENREILLHQMDYVDKVLNKFGMSMANPVPTPEQLGEEQTQESTPITEATPFKELLGSLLYLATCTRPDIAHAVGIASRTAAPTQENWAMLKRILRYLKGSKNLGIRFKWEENAKLQGYSDADFANDPVTRRSTTGFCIMYCGGPISWRSQKQSIVTLSTTEAEYISGCELVKEIIPIRTISIELGVIDEGEHVDVYIDNQSTVKIAKDDGGQNRTKHIDVRHKWLNEQVTANTVRVKHIPAALQKADLLTKPLRKNKFLDNRAMLLASIYEHKSTKSRECDKIDSSRSNRFPTIRTPVLRRARKLHYHPANSESMQTALRSNKHDK